MAMNEFRVQLNPRRGGYFQGAQGEVLTGSLPDAIKRLDALPGDALWVEAAAGDDLNLTFMVESGPHGLIAVPA